MGPPRDNGIYGALWSNNTQGQDKKEKPGDDPYYFGLSARIPNFVKSRKKKQKERDAARARSAPGPNPPNNGVPSQLPAHPFWWHSRIYPDGSGSPADSNGFSRTPTNFVPYG